MKIEMNDEISQKAVDKVIEGLKKVFEIRQEQGSNVMSTYIGLSQLAKELPESLALFTVLGLTIVGARLEDEGLIPTPEEYKQQLENVLKEYNENI